MSVLTPNTIVICKGTAPILKERGVDVTTRFYEILFRDYPIAKNLFNMSHQKHGDQPGAQTKSLAYAVYAYAANIDNLEALSLAVERIAHKHVSFGVSRDMYPMVGKVLLQALKEVLGAAATDDICNAWVEAYNYLADLFIEREKQIRDELDRQPNGYSTWTKMVVKKKEVETSEITSFYLKPQNENGLPLFNPGQYLSFKVDGIPGLDHSSCRNYSLSIAPGAEYYRVSIKRENQVGAPLGVVSNFLHDNVHVGMVLEVGPPCGHFSIDQNSRKPLVLIGGGVGVTPLITMLDSTIAKGQLRQVLFIHYARSYQMAPFKEHVDTVASSNSNVTSVAIYTGSHDGDVENLGFKATKIFTGRFNAAALTELIAEKDSEVYAVGPEGLMLEVHRALIKHGVPSAQINHEYFGPEAAFDV